MTTAASQSTVQSTEANKARTRRFVEEVLQRGNVDLIDELVALDVVDHGALPGQAAGRDGYKRSVQMLLRAFPAAQWRVADLLADGDAVVARFTMRGTHGGPLLGWPATGRPVSVTGIVISRYQDGVVAEAWMEWDLLGLLQQIGAISPPEPVTLAFW